MVGLHVLGRLRQYGDLRAYRRSLMHEIGQDLALRLLPALGQLPLPIIDIDGTPCVLNTAVQEMALVTLAGASGSGRRLALQQLALRWAANDSSTPPFPALLVLPRLDDGHTLPTTLLLSWMQTVGQTAGARPPYSLLSRLRANAAAYDTSDHLSDWLLLIDGWEELSAERRVAWRTALIDAPRIWPELRIVVTIPHTEPAWLGFRALTVAPPSPPMIAQWIERLAPVEQCAALQSALAVDGHLHPLAERLYEIILLVWLKAETELPRTRAELYAHTLARFLQRAPDQLTHDPSVAELQLLAAYGEQPTTPIAWLVEEGTPTSRFIHPQIRRYFAARQIVAERRYMLLHTIGQTERDELCLLLVTMLDDPSPVYATIWGTGNPCAEDILTLGRCLRERSPHNPTWVLRVVGALAWLARNGPYRAIARDLLAVTMPALDTSLSVALNDERAWEFLLRLFDLLPSELSIPRLERLIYLDGTPEPLAWALADRLGGHQDAPPSDPPSTPQLLARWIYVYALRLPQQHHLLDLTIVEPALAVLAESNPGSARQQRAAAALLDNPDFLPPVRVAALAILAQSDHPTSLAVIERAVSDKDDTIRQGALDVLSRRDPLRAYATFSQIVFNQTADWEVRIDVLLHLGEMQDLGAGDLLERFAASAPLPLYARLQAITALARQAPGQARLMTIVADTRSPAHVRAAAARQLGTTGYLPAVSTLMRLLETSSTTGVLAQALCDSLGALGDLSAGPTLVRTLERAIDDSDLTVAAIRALGALGDREAIPTLSQLLGAEALTRLHRAVDLQQQQLLLETCLDTPTLPRPLARRVVAALASGTTSADRPTTLAELLTGEADRIRMTAAAALAAIGSSSAHAALLSALLDGTTGGATANVVAALCHDGSPESAAVLGYLLDEEQIDTLTHWLAVQQLEQHPEGEPILLRSLARTALDPFIRGALAEALGQRGTLVALPLLHQIVQTPDDDQHLRSQAIIAIGILDQPISEAPLLQVITNQDEPILLRGLAAEHLPDHLSTHACHILRTFLAEDQPPPALVAGALRALGRAHDHEALPLVIRYCQDSTPLIAEAAIDALIALNSPNKTPILEHIMQNPDADPTVRLTALGALAQLASDTYRPLLFTTIERESLPIQLQALEHIIATSITPDELIAMLADHTWPQPLRLRLLGHLSNLPNILPLLCHIIDDDEDNLALRTLAIEALERAWNQAAIPALIRVASRTSAHPSLRLRAIRALGVIGGTKAGIALSTIHSDRTQPTIIRDTALLALGCEEYDLATDRRNNAPSNNEKR